MGDDVAPGSPTAPGAPGTVAILAPMPDELRPVVKLLGLQRVGEQGGMSIHAGRAGEVPVVATRTGIGPELAEAAAERLLSSRPVDRVVVTGIAGGIAPVSAVGDLIVPAEVVDAATGDRFRATPVGDVVPEGVIRTGDGTSYELDDVDLGRLRDGGITALDMETAAIARVCQRHGVPWLAFRVISDMAGDQSVGPAVMTMVHPDGRPKPLTAIGYLLTHPGRIPRMVRLGRDARRAAVTAARASVANAGLRLDPSW